MLEPNAEVKIVSLKLAVRLPSPSPEFPSRSDVLATSQIRDAAALSKACVSNVPFADQLPYCHSLVCFSTRRLRHACRRPRRPRRLENLRPNLEPQQRVSKPRDVLWISGPIPALFIDDIVPGLSATTLLKTSPTRPPMLASTNNLCASEILSTCR